MAGGYLRKVASLQFPGDEQREKYAREVPGFQPNPLFDQLFRQHQTALDPKVQRTRLRRQFGGVSDQVIRGTQGATQQMNESLAARGLGSSGIGAAATGSLLQNQAFQRAQLPMAFHEALALRQRQAQEEALQFLLAMLSEERSARGMHEGIKARKDAKPTGFQSVLGDVNAVTGALGGLIGILGQKKDASGAGGSGVLGYF